LKGKEMKDIPEMKIDINIDEKKFSRDINEDLLIDSNNLDEALEKQAALYAYYSITLQQATALRDQAEFDYERTLNDAIQTARTEFSGSEKRITDKQVMAVVGNAPEVLAAKQLFLKFSAQRDQLYALVRALEHKKDNLIAIAYRRRSEIEAIGNKTIYGKIPRSGLEDEI